MGCKTELTLDKNYERALEAHRYNPNHNITYALTFIPQWDSITNKLRKACGWGEYSKEENERARI